MGGFLYLLSSVYLFFFHQAMLGNVFTFTDTTYSPVPASKLFTALVVDAHNLLPKLVPQVITSMELIQGAGGAGSIVQINFAQGMPMEFVKYRVDVLDKDKLAYANTVIEGGKLSDKIESVKREVKFESSPSGGSIYNNMFKFYTTAGAEVTEEEIYPGKEADNAVFQAVEDYLLANPDSYNAKDWGGQ